MPPVRGRLRTALSEFIEDFQPGERVASFTQKKADSIENIAAEENFEPLEDVRKALSDIEGYGTWANRQTGGKQAGGVIVVIGAAIGLIVSIATTGMQPIGAMVNYFINRKVKSARLDPSVVIPFSWRYPDLEPKARFDLGDLGYDADREFRIEEVLRPRLDAKDEINLWRRNIITLPELHERLHALGYSPTVFPDIQKATEIMPSLQDVISVAVREGFNDELARRFQLDEDFPKELEDYGRRIGVADNFERRLWRAHWRLPGVLQMFEAFHRLRPGRYRDPDSNQQVTFDRGDLDAFLRANDISPRFRPILTALSFQLMTRVDIRRAYRIGAINFQDGKERYKDAGYDDSTAEVLMTIAADESLDEDKALTRAQVLSFYEDGFYSRQQAIESIQAIGYSIENATLFVMSKDFDIEIRNIKERLDVIEFRFLNHEIEENELRDLLSRLGLNQDRLSVIVGELVAKRLRQIKLPTQSNLDDFYEENIINRNEFRDGLKALKWDDNRVGWFIELTDRRIQQKQQKETERAREELEREQRRDRTDALGLSKAIFDVQINEKRLEIAEIKLAINYEEDDSVLIDMADAIEELKVDIAELQLAKSRAIREGLQ